MNPGAYWARFFKGIYFPNSSFLQAARGSPASWAWLSLLHGRSLLDNDLRWQVQDGKVSISGRTQGFHLFQASKFLLLILLTARSTWWLTSSTDVRDSVWFGCNIRPFEDLGGNSSVIKRAADMLEKLTVSVATNSISKMDNPTTQEELSTWKAPDKDKLKINCDVAIPVTGKVSKAAEFLRIWRGKILDGFARSIRIGSSFGGELQAIRAACEVVINFGLNGVQVSLIISRLLPSVSELVPPRDVRGVVMDIRHFAKEAAIKFKWTSQSHYKTHPPSPPSPLFQKNNSAETQPKTVRVCPSPSSSALLRNLKSQPQILEDSVSATPESSAKLDSVNGSSKVWGNEDGVLDLRGHGLWSLPVEEFGACFACTFQVIQLKRLAPSYYIDLFSVAVSVDLEVFE
ncbi:hypothetical protein RHMOL_Rhmol04G0126800 [Rhododendron molle]|uniref:Uncharacterized protein n=1 Tax=Rhododendron molle TaxID=49168 RepID=A0ACC0NZM8_RHOML|nr:hypothetical protein RHMOL_Rhmol04G0126800 [Rhododendron molle]